MLLFVDQLTNVDFSYLDPVRGLLGETYLANIRLKGALDEQGMVCDFGKVKKQCRAWLDDELDHRLAVPAQSPHLSLEDLETEYRLEGRFGDGEVLKTRCPKDAIALVDTDRLTPESIASWCISQLKALFPTSVDQLDLDFSIETIDGASYHYSHGLKKHLGNCQRIAHGHRSRLDIWIDNEKAPQVEQDWAKKWCDIYIGTREDIRAEFSENGIDYLHFTYRSQQGEFELILPKQRCYLIDTDSTVELIATHFANETAKQFPGKQIKVKAFEGINKGAIAEALLER